MSFSFEFASPSLFTGRWARAHRADKEAFLSLIHGSRGFWPHLVWPLGNQVLHCPALSSVPLYSLVDTLLETRSFLASQFPLLAFASPADLGSLPFLINESGQVILPAPDARIESAALAGECEGSLLFQDPTVPGKVMDLSLEGDLSPGDPWEWPALGLPYHLSRRTHVYFQHGDGRQEEPREQDWELIEALRDIVKNGPVRFIVNPWGLATVKTEEGWKFAGKVRREFWFEKEER